MKTDIKAEFSQHIINCLFNKYGQHTDPAKVQKLWTEARTKEEFIAALKQDPDLKYGQACGEIAKYDFYFVREMLGDREFKTECDGGSVRLVHDGFSVWIPTGGGDGIARVAVFEQGEEFNTSALKYFTLIDGTFDISGYDCGLMPVRTLTGRYSVYFGNGFVVFMESA